jgi:hypothetical protein
MSASTHVSRIELRRMTRRSFQWDFIIDEKSLLETFPLIEFLSAEDRANPKENEEIANVLRLTMASRLGNGSPEWQVRALDQLLLRGPPELPDGKRRLYICGGNCECEHIACLIERQDGLFIWRDFVLGSPVDSQAETFRDNAWQRVDFYPSANPKSSPLTAGPFCFEESAYKAVFEPLYEKIASG